MNYRTFESSLWTKINEVIALANVSASPKFAAFDADGTLWDTDIGENFFEFQIKNRLVPLPPNPWEHYFELKKKGGDPREAYLWLAQINEGRRLEEVQSWATEALSAISEIPYFREQKKLISLLHENDFQVFVVTASVAWAVEPAASLFNIPRENVIGVRTNVSAGLVTTEAVQPITYREGKAEALLKATKGMRPWICSGNSIGDIELLKTAQGLALAVGSVGNESRLYSSEKFLRDFVQERTQSGDELWAYHAFVSGAL